MPDPLESVTSRGGLEVRWLGRVPYSDGLALQEDVVLRRKSGEVPDTLLLLEHPHVITLGTASTAEHVLVGDQERAELGVDLVEVGRGGDVTYHGPGQLVGYPILDLKPDRKDLHRYLRDLEEVVIRSVRSMGVPARRVPGLTGVWTDLGKIAAIGVRVSSGWITSHGFALNVHTDLTFFRTIVPCGISDQDVTSLSRELGRDVSLDEVRPSVIRAFKEVFGHGSV
ncbi:MAG TPA: lipoyl(octanoyl) transferase LipB [Longimicrobiales bacterium]|nr:lipoyl(octanoyl) transferase LipB [Longimicrobiales bacterium]